MDMLDVARLHKLDNGSNLKAFADVIVGDMVLIKGVRVVAGKDDSLYVSMPKEKAKDGKWYETVTLLDEGLKQELQAVVLEKYQSE
jgi:DNA-binding cell septation regulator SpoVG